MATVVVNHGALEATAGDLANDATYLQSCLDDLDTQIQRLLGQWEGEAQQAYHAAKTNWTQAMTDIKATLAAISQLLSTTNQTFSSIDKQGAAQWG